MRRLPLAAVLLLTSALRAQTLGPVDWIFLVDTSSSMRGIWKDVQECLDSFVREASDQDTVAIYAFDRDVRAIQTASRGNLTPEGNRTHLGAAIATGLERAEQLRRSGSDRTRRQVVVLFTDGKEDIRGIKDPVHIESNLDRVNETFVFFVSMGEHEPQLDAFAAKTQRTTVLKAPTAEAIRNVARDVRAQIEPPAPPPQPKPNAKPKPPIVSPPVEKSFPWIRSAIALALLAVATFLFLQQQHRKNRLEGELEILRPRIASDSAFVGLPNLRVSEVALSALLPLDALGGSDARLFVRRKDGRKKVWIAAQSGSLRINDVETPMSELYDADTIDIGDARVRFNRVGDERPTDLHEGGEL